MLLETGKENKNRTYTSIVMMLFWAVFSFSCVYDGYLPGLDGTTRYIILIWLALIFFTISKNIFRVKPEQFAMLIWLIYYFMTLLWTAGFEQARLYILTIASMTLLYIALQYFTYSDGFCKFLREISKAVSVSVGLLAVFFNTLIGSGTRQVLYLFGNYIDPNDQVAIMAVGTGLCLLGIFSEKGIVRIYNIIGCLVCVYSTFMTGSRSGIVVMAAEVVVFLIFWHPKRNNFLRKAPNG